MTTALLQPTAPEVVDPLTPAEQDRLAELEATVDKGRETFLQVSHALAEIHARRLYRQTHRSWEKYLRHRFDLSAPRGYELLRAAAVADAIAADGGTPPASEAAIRPLTSVLSKQGPEAAAEAWKRVEAQHDGDRPPTSRQVREILAADTRVGPHRSRLDEAGRLLAGLERYLRRIGVRPLDESLRPSADRYGRRAQRVAEDLAVLASGGVLMAPADEPCVGHGRVRLESGACARCGRQDRKSTV